MLLFPLNHFPEVSPLQSVADFSREVSVLVQREVIPKGSSPGLPGGGCGKMLEPLAHPSLSWRSCEAGKKPNLIPGGWIAAP